MKLAFALPIAVPVLLAAPAGAQWIEATRTLYRLSGEVPGGQFGYSVANAGDADGDGIDDLAVGAPFHGSRAAYAGRVRVFSGRNGAELWRADGAVGDLFGWALDGAGDLDRDGRADLWVGAPGWKGEHGRVALLSGADGRVLTEHAGAMARERFGEELASIGDFDGDGFADLAIGARRHCGRVRGGGRVTIVSGRNGSVLAEREGDVENGRFGSAVDGDFSTGDGWLVVGEPGGGEPRDGERHGRVHVLRGRELEPLFTIEADATGVELGRHGAVLAGDVDGDGVPDVAASDWKNRAHGPSTGRLVVHSGADGQRLLELTGEFAGDGFGVGGCAAGDVNGDGHDDLLVGAWLARDAAARGGRVRLVSGADGSALFTWTGSVANAVLGFASAALGDVDGDGAPDFALAAAWDPSTGPKSGRVSVVSGVAPRLEDAGPGDLSVARSRLRQHDFDGAAELLRARLADEPRDAQSLSLLGFALHAAGRWNEALIADLQAAQFPRAAATALYNAACAHALLGNTDQAFAYLDRARRAGFGDLRHVESDPDLAALRDDPRWSALFAPVDEAAPFVEADAVALRHFDGEAEGDRFGWVVDAAGDCDGDGRSEILVGAPFHREGGVVTGRAYLFAGADGRLLWRFDGEPGDQLGYAVAGVGDVDGDGRADCAVGAPGPSVGAGRVLVYSGRTGAVLARCEGAARGDRFGATLAAIGDVDGDGRGDLAVGASGHDGAAGVDAGAVSVLALPAGRALATIEGAHGGDQLGSGVAGRFDGTTRVLLVGALNAGPSDRGEVWCFRGDFARPAFVLDGDAGCVHYGRTFLSVLDDVDGDGVADLYSSDWEHRGLGRASGRAWVHSGADGRVIHMLAARAPGEGFGIGKARVGDLDGDGVGDLVIGAWQSSEAAERGGRASAYSGLTGEALFTWSGAVAGASLGFDTAGVGDLNGDGVPDVLVSAVDHSGSGHRAGRVYLMSGAPVFARAMALRERAEEPTASALQEPAGGR